MASTFIDDLNATLSNFDTVWLRGLGPPRFQDFRPSDNIEDRRRQHYYNLAVDPPPQEIVGREQGTGFDYDYLSFFIRAALGVSNPLSIEAGINNIK
jgi:hypothetical protein